ncbi:MAG: hypothetical protein AB7U75_13990 [Hyphomicrobiaceae bacterium]
MQRRDLWEILVPMFWNGVDHGLTTQIKDEHHQEWDAFVRGLSGGLTLLKPIKGQWVDPSGLLIQEPMIPVRIVCTKPEIDKIIQFTLGHYEQRAVMAYRLSNEVLITKAKINFELSDQAFINSVKRAISTHDDSKSYHLSNRGDQYFVIERYFPGIEVQWTDILEVTRDQAYVLEASETLAFWNPKDSLL